ncbi:MAG: hypothetical protein ABR520_08635 [Mycobacteriales bacterium]|nr:hypothetical protein [Frankia sp.]
MVVHTTTPFAQDARATIIEFVHETSSYSLAVFLPRCAPGVVPSVPPQAQADYCAPSNALLADVRLSWSDASGQSFRAPSGPYDVFVYPVHSRRVLADSCTGCFTVLHAADILITSVAPAQLPAGTNGGPFVVNGYNFSADAVVEALFPGTNRVDDAIRFSSWRPATQPWSRSQSLERAYSISSTAALGRRDIRVTVPYGRSGRLRGALTVTRRS